MEKEKKFLEKVKFFPGFWTRQDCVSHPQALFIFGDNDVGTGKKGQAVIRGLPNAMGIPTKKFPSLVTGSFYVDDELEQNCFKMKCALEKIVEASENFEIVYFPEDGLGTGLAQMAKHCPKTLEYLQKKTLLKDIYL
jgi:hypothetical protein